MAKAAATPMPRPNSERHHPGAAGIRRERPAWHFGAVEQAHVVRAAVADDAQFLLALQQRFVHLPVALGLPLQHGVVDALAVQVGRLHLLAFEIDDELLLLGQCGLVVRLDARNGLVDLRVELALRVANLAVDALDVGMLVAVPLFEPHLVTLQLADARLELLDEGVRRDGGEAFAILGGEHLVVEGFLLDARHPRARRGVVHLVQPRHDDVLAILERQRVLVLAVLGQHPLARLHDVLLLGDFFRQPLQRLVGVRQPELEVLVDVFLREHVHRARREGRAPPTRSRRPPGGCHEPGQPAHGR